MPSAGTLDRRVAFFRRVVLGSQVAGNERGKYEVEPYLTVWANFRQTPGREALASGLVEDKIGGTLRIRDSTSARAVTSADRVRLGGAEFAIESVGLPEIRQGFIELVIKRERAG